MRAGLSMGIGALCLACGLYAANTQARSHALAADLDMQKRRCDLLEAKNERTQYEIKLSLDRIEAEFINPTEAISE